MAQSPSSFPLNPPLSNINEPLEGTSVATFQEYNPEKETKEEFLGRTNIIIDTIKVSGRVFDTSTNSPIQGARIRYSYVYNTILSSAFRDGSFESKTVTDIDGKFTLEIEIYARRNNNLPILKGQNDIFDRPIIEINSPISESSKYVSTFKPIIKRDGYILENTGAIGLNPRERDYQQQIAQINSGPSEAEADLITKNSPQDSKGGIIKFIKKQALSISKTLIPSIIKQFKELGIDDITKFAKKEAKKYGGKAYNEAVSQLNEVKNNYVDNFQCPPKEKIEDLIQKKNKLTRKLNNIYKVIDVALKTLGIFGGLLIVFKNIRQLFKVNPIPSTIGTPPGPAGGVIISQSSGKILRYHDKADKIAGLASQFEKIGSGISAALILLKSQLQKAITLIQGLDLVLQKCAEEAGVGLTQVELDDQLLNATLSQDEDGEIVNKEVNGFTLLIQEEVDNPVGTLKRRFAIAKNVNGVTVLKGEPSFSSGDQILIDELSFYITSNNLKGF
tara:strand:- start:3670 stop:5178 length:1509 start_codon:yes stop_codon:yes gene_type:complete